LVGPSIKGSEQKREQLEDPLSKEKK